MECSVTAERVTQAAPPLTWGLSGDFSVGNDFFFFLISFIVLRIPNPYDQILTCVSEVEATSLGAVSFFY